MTGKLRWGILGTGNIARQFASALATSERCIISAVGSRSPEQAAGFAARFGIPTAAGYDELIQTATVDAVYVALPNSLHHEWTIKALHAGKHVLCEKPLALDAKQSEEMFEAAAKSGRLLVEAFMYRSHPLTHAVVAAVQSNAIGRLKLIRTSFCFSMTGSEENIRLKAALGGGSLLDTGCYCINLTRLLAGQEPSQISVSAHHHHSGTDDLVAGTMVFASGVIGSFVCGLTVQTDNSACICGEEGYVQVPVPWKPPRQQAEFTIVKRGERNTQHIDAAKDLYAFEADDFAATVLDGLPPAVSRQDSLGNMRVLDEIRRQIAL